MKKKEFSSISGTYKK